MLLVIEPKYKPNDRRVKIIEPLKPYSGNTVYVILTVNPSPETVASVRNSTVAVSPSTDKGGGGVTPQYLQSVKLAASQKTIAPVSIIIDHGSP